MAAGVKSTMAGQTASNAPKGAAAGLPKPIAAAALVAQSGLRGRMAAILQHPWFERFIIGIIVLNAITLGMETSKSLMANYGDALHVVDNILLAIFVAELIARVFVYRAAFFRDPWSLFDAAVVAIALMPASGEWSILRALRIVRALRLITAIPSIRRVVASLLGAVPSMGSIVALLLLINYVFSVMATKLFGADFEAKFGTLGASFFTFFQIMTLEGWSGEVVRPVMEKYPWAWAFFVPYIVLATFMVLNLFIGIIVDAMATTHEEEKAQTLVMTPAEKAMMAELQALRSELDGLRREMGGKGDLPLTGAANLAGPAQATGQTSTQSPQQPRNHGHGKHGKRRR